MDGPWDVVVVGAGPAGSAAALAARRARPEASVLLLDRAEFPRDKSCGDGIAPHAMDVLARLGVGDVVDDYQQVTRLSLAAPSGRTVTRPLSRPDRVVPRAVFDARLVVAAERAGVVHRQHRVRSLVTRPGRVVVDGEIAARTLVAADGAHSVVRRALGLARNPDHALAVAIRAYAPAHDAVQRIHLVAAHWPSYAWTFPIGDGRANVGYGAFRADFPGQRKDFLGALEDALGPTGLDPDTVLGHPLPVSSHRPPAAVGRILLVGDAASLINPVSGEGIYYALASGELAGRAAAGDPRTAARRYPADLHSLLGRHLRHTGTLARLVRTRAVAEAGVAATARRQGAFDDLCELTLGGGHITPRLAVGTAGHLLVGRRSGPRDPVLFGSGPVSTHE
ncbi:NAD(P)/FAD-dependent oxidoreductase [Egibacter rhizosphaerae]|uniref:NAD(P)/FAD-dependent oxidoreductase n=1 Tax=Egibacter rhizosphaerae TaxID=1670831 RepID=A0A411YAH9_9ACTN|nr:NAD(P)/FAD-dependent oxidoreductase [Egibacter rhizosphaerae]QBI18205.1 NAD(P)/FAD-dependent oxidoreductase [Egibacter rhizosphaerae]